MTYLAQMLAIVGKDLATEWRSRDRALAAAAFSVLAVLLFAMAFEGSGAQASAVAAPVVWMTLVFAGLLAVARTFALEREDGALVGVLQSPAPRDAIYLGKTVANAVIVLPSTLLALTSLIVVLDLELPSAGATTALVGTLTLGTVAFVAPGTLLSVISTGARAGDALLLVITLPLMVPVIVFGTGASSRLLSGRPVAEALPEMRWLGAFALVGLFSGAVLFRHLVEE